MEGEIKTSARITNKIQQTKTTQSIFTRLLSCSVLSVLCILSLSACDKEQAEKILKAEILPPEFIPQIPETPVHDIFSLEPGTIVSMAAMTGVIDPVGTSLPQDFDGDGITNDNETTSNVWVSDHPEVNVSVSTPITLKIEILRNKLGVRKEIISNIAFDDMEDTKHKGSEKLHRNETSERTTQFVDSFSRNESSSGSASISANVSYGSFSGGGSKSKGWSKSSGYSETKTKWKDVPGKNHLDRDKQVVKSGSAAKKARKLRKEARDNLDTSSEVKSDAGYIRAALYIENNSVNLPVKLSNILCSLMFEDADGQLIPVQSFRLRNEDFSLFEVEIYGGEEFGPYVIELGNLNTFEIEKAIAKGHTPRIFIIDHEMRHVADSNYRSRLLNYSGDNLKIIEENAKGRTALFRIFGPNIREKFRITAFDTDGTGDPCMSSSYGSNVTPGVSMRKALERLKCSGIDVEFGKYVSNLAEILPTLDENQVYFSAVKSVNGVTSNVPCETIVNPQPGDAGLCIIKPIEYWTDEEKQNAGFWVIYSDAKFYDQTGYEIVSNVRQTFSYTITRTHTGEGLLQLPVTIQETISGPKLIGVDSKIWAGDQYDLVYLRARDFLAEEEDFGSSLLATGQSAELSTLWDKKSLGDEPFETQRAQHLGQAAFGEQIMLSFKLTRNRYLEPDFGTANTSISGISRYTDFSYACDPYSAGTDEDCDSSQRLELAEVADFEMSIVSGGRRTSWFHILKDAQASDDYKHSLCGVSFDYDKQEFQVCVQLPEDHTQISVELNPLANVYIRPAFSNVYRKAVWPVPYSKVAKFQAITQMNYASGATSISLTDGTGTLETTDTLKIDGTSYAISSASETNGVYSVTLAVGLGGAINAGTRVHVEGALTSPNLELVVDDDFVSTWNSDSDIVTDTPTTTQLENWRLPKNAQLETRTANTTDACTKDDFSALDCIGHLLKRVVLNWFGGDNHGVPAWNAWADSSNVSSMTTEGMLQLTTSGDKNIFMDTKPTRITTDTLGGSFAARTFGNQDTYTFVVWVENHKNDSDVITGYTIYGQVFETASAKKKGSRLQIHTNSLGLAGYMNLSLHSHPTRSKAVVNWYSSDNSNTGAHFIDLSTPASPSLMGVTFAIPCYNFQFYIDDADETNDKAYCLVHGSHYTHTGGSSQNGLYIESYHAGSTNAGTPVRARYQVVSPYSSTRNMPFSSGKYAIIYYEKSSQLYMRSLDMSQGVGSGLSNEAYIGRGIWQASLRTASETEGACLFAYRHATDNRLYLTVIHCGNGSNTSAMYANLLTSSTSFSDVQIFTSGTKAIVVWKEGSTWYREVIDLSTSTVALDRTATTISDNSIGAIFNNYYLQRRGHGGSVFRGATDNLFIWRNAGKTELRARRLDFNNNGAPFGPEYILATGSGIEPGSWVQLPFSEAENNGLLFYRANDSSGKASIFMKRITKDLKFVLPKHGLNNFFVSPLVERQYELKASIRSFDIESITQ